MQVQAATLSASAIRDLKLQKTNFSGINGFTRIWIAANKSHKILMKTKMELADKLHCVPVRLHFYKLVPKINSIQQKLKHHFVGSARVRVCVCVQGIEIGTLANYDCNADVDEGKEVGYSERGSEHEAEKLKTHSSPWNVSSFPLFIFLSSFCFQQFSHFPFAYHSCSTSYGKSAMSFVFFFWRKKLYSM